MNKEGYYMDGVSVIAAAVLLVTLGFFLGVVYTKLTHATAPQPGKIVIEHRYPEGK